MKKKICMILIAVFAAVFGTSTYFIIDHYKESNKQAELYGKLADLVNAAAQMDAATEPAEQIPYSEEKMLLPELAELYRPLIWNISGWHCKATIMARVISIGRSVVTVVMTLPMHWSFRRI